MFITQPRDVKTLNGNQLPFPLSQRPRHPMFWSLGDSLVGEIIRGESFRPMAGLPFELGVPHYRFSADDIWKLVNEFPLDQRLLRRNSLRYRTVWQVERLDADGSSRVVRSVGNVADITPDEAWRYNLHSILRQLTCLQVTDLLERHGDIIKRPRYLSTGNDWHWEVFVRAVMILSQRTAEPADVQVKQAFAKELLDALAGTLYSGIEATVTAVTMYLHADQLANEVQDRWLEQLMASSATVQP
ncbi:MAG TPA: hypothetical protein VLG40_01665 [Candidatus Saccharimonas sp.]|nr:hypothetical protein [Candidatus Saccharimonas sp.]